MTSDTSQRYYTPCRIQSISTVASFVVYVLLVVVTAVLAVVVNMSVEVLVIGVVAGMVITVVVDVVADALTEVAIYVLGDGVIGACFSKLVDVEIIVVTVSMFSKLLCQYHSMGGRNNWYGFACRYH